MRPRQRPGCCSLRLCRRFSTGHWATPGTSLRHWAPRASALSCVTRGRGSPSLSQVLRDGSCCCVRSGYRGWGKRPGGGRGSLGPDHPPPSETAKDSKAGLTSLGTESLVNAASVAGHRQCIQRNILGWGSRPLHSRYWLCDIQQVTKPPWA